MFIKKSHISGSSFVEGTVTGGIISMITAFFEVVEHLLIGQAKRVIFSIN